MLIRVPDRDHRFRGFFGQRGWKTMAAMRGRSNWGVRLTRWGLWTLALGSGPLLLFMAAAWLGLTSEPDANPMGLGALFFFTFWPGLAMLVAGLLVRAVDRLG